MREGPGQENGPCVRGSRKQPLLRGPSLQDGVPDGAENQTEPRLGPPASSPPHPRPRLQADALCLLETLRPPSHGESGSAQLGGLGTLRGRAWHPAVPLPPCLLHPSRAPKARCSWGVFELGGLRCPPTGLFVKAGERKRVPGTSRPRPGTCTADPREGLVPPAAPVFSLTARPHGHPPTQDRSWWLQGPRQATAKVLGPPGQGRHSQGLKPRGPGQEIHDSGKGSLVTARVPGGPLRASRGPVGGHVWAATAVIKYKLWIY